MRYKAEQKAEIRKNMVDAAARAFRRSGYAGVGVDGIAAEAGATSGAIYSQFGSKEGAFVEAMGAGMELFVQAVPQFQEKHGAKWLSAFVDFYLSAEHRADVAGGCTIATLVPDVVRSESAAVRGEFEGKAAKIVELMTVGLGGPAKTREERAWAVVATLVGGINLVRALPAGGAAEVVVKAVRRAAVEAAGEVR